MKQQIKILNLYACLGGNRYKWNDVAEIEVTAVENDPELARLYQLRFPNDKVVVTDAHQYLLEHYQSFDFIWSSPPCPTHSRLNWINKGIGARKCKPVFPDLKLYEEIIFLQTFYKGKFCVENVISYYNPLIEPQKRGRHYYWTNFKLPIKLSNKLIPKNFIKGKINNIEKYHEIDLSDYKGEQRKNKIARNLVCFEAGKTILQTALDKISPKHNIQTLF